MGSEQRLRSEREFISKISSYFPKFTDIFDEETFYIFAFFFVLATILIAYLLSRCVEISDPDYKGVTYTRLNDRKHRYKLL